MADRLDEGITHTIRAFIRQNFPLAQHTDVSVDASLLQQGIIDSLGLLSLVSFVEERFGVVVSDADVVDTNFGSIAALTAYVTRARPQPAPLPEAVGASGVAEPMAHLEDHAP